MGKKLVKGSSTEYKKKTLKAQQNLKKMLKRVEPFKVKKDSASPSTTGRWCKTTNLCD